MKNNFWKVLALVLCLVMVFSLVACNEPAGDDPSKAPATEAPATEAPDDDTNLVGDPEASSKSSYTGEPIKFGYIEFELGEFRNNVWTGMQKACQERGYAEPQFGMTDGDPTKQRTYTEAFLNSGIDVMVDFFCNPETGAAMTALCNEKGVKMISIDCDYGEGSYFFGTDNKGCAKANGESLANWVKANWDGQLDKFIRFWSPTSGEVIGWRTEGGWAAFCSVLTEYAAKEADVLSEIQYDKDQLVSRQRTVDWWTKNDTAKHVAVIVLCDPHAQIVDTATKSVDKWENYIVASCNCDMMFLQQCIELKGTARWYSSINFRPWNYGNLIVNLAEKLMMGEQVAHMTFFDLPVCTYENIDEMFPTEWEKYATAEQKAERA